MAETGTITDWGKIIRRIVGVVVIIMGVPMMMRQCSHQDALNSILADGNRQAGAYDAAIAQYTALIKQNPNLASAYAGRGEAWRLKGDLDRAFADLDRAIGLDANHYDARIFRCSAWRQKGDLPRAIVDCEAAGRIKPDDPGPPTMIGQMLVARGDVDAALPRLDAAIAAQKEGSGSLDARFYRGQIALFYQGRPADASQDFAKVLDRAFDYVETARMLGGSGSTAMMAYQHPFVPDAYYVVMWQHIARVRAGTADATELADNVRKIVKAVKGNPLLSLPTERSPSDTEVLAEVLRPWPGRFIALYLGRLDADNIRPAAEAMTDVTYRRRYLCDVDFYLGLHALQTGAAAEGRRLIQAAADGCPASAPEAGFAKAELRRLGS